MPKLPLAATAVASILVTLATGSVAQTLPPNLPLAIICFNEKTQTWRIGYIDVVAPDGSATYVAGDLWATVNAKGLVQPPIAQQASTALARPWMTCALLAASWSSSALSKNQPNAIANELHTYVLRIMTPSRG